MMIVNPTSNKPIRLDFIDVTINSCLANSVEMIYVFPYIQSCTGGKIMSGLVKIVCPGIEYQFSTYYKVALFHF